MVRGERTVVEYGSGLSDCGCVVVVNALVGINRRIVLVVVSGLVGRWSGDVSRPIVGPIWIGGKGCVNQALVGVGEGMCIFERGVEIRYGTGFPTAQILIESGGIVKKITHACDG